ncbi:MAG: DM13 domain-containing protein [Spirosomataceae bacterium]
MKTTFILLLLTLALASCTKTEELQPVTSNPTNNGSGTTTPQPITSFDTNGQKLLGEGNLSGSGSYTVSGSVKLYEKDSKRTLVFTNIKSSNGPDLRWYLSEDKVASKFVEVSSKVNVGDYFLELPATANPNNQKFVLIWCKQFSVLFGSAELK